MRLFLLLLCASLALPPGAWAQASRLPNLGDGAEITLGAERRIGDNIAREIYRDPAYVDDPVLRDYVDSIWQPLLAAARMRGELLPEMEQQFAWDISLIRDRSINAFALPGGYLGVHLGLIAAVTSADELASVLAHELTHVTQRHIARMIDQQGRQSPLMIGAMIVGMLAATRAPVNSSSANAASAMMVGGQAAAVQSQLNFSRDMEREADRVGYGVMTQAGFEAQSFVTMFEKLQQAARLNDNGSFPYLRSHPMTTERIADAQARQELLPRRPPLELMPLHAMMAARAQVLTNPGVETLRSMSLQPDSVPPRPPTLARQAAILYAAVLSELRLRELPRAKRHMAQLQSLTGLDAPAQRVVRLLAAEVAVSTDEAAKAVALLEHPSAGPVESNRPSERANDRARDRATRLLLAQARVATQQPAQARIAEQDLVGWVANRPRDALAWLTLSTAYQAQGDALRALRAQAEARLVELDYGAAVDRFKSAQELAIRLAREGKLDRAGNVEASIIDARLRESERLRREQMLQR
jgi:predicted Zn-dependent protease